MTKGVFSRRAFQLPVSMNNRAGFWKDFLEALFQCLTATNCNQKKGALQKYSLKMQNSKLREPIINSKEAYEAVTF